MPKRGRPPLSEEQACVRAAEIISLAHALRYRPAALKTLGHTPDSASHVVLGTRYQGKVRALIGDSINTLFPPPNRTALAVSLVLDHNLTIYRAAKLAKADTRNVKRALAAGEAARAERALRIVALKTKIACVD